MKKLYLIIIIILAILLCSCGETYHHSYSQRKGFMLLKSTEQKANSKYNSSKEINKKKRTYKKLHKR